MVLDNKSEFVWVNFPPLVKVLFSSVEVTSSWNPLGLIYHLMFGVDTVYSECALTNCLHVKTNAKNSGGTFNSWDE